MKLLSTYLKEMKIALRGFYFYIEIFIALLLLIIVIVAIKDFPNSKVKEYVYYDMEESQKEAILSAQINSDEIIQVEDTKLSLKGTSFDVVNKETDEVVSYSFAENKDITVKTLKVMNLETNQVLKTIYIMDSEEDLIRLSMKTGNQASTIEMNNLGELSYRYLVQGYESKRHLNFLYLTHSLSGVDIENELNNQDVLFLGTKERLSNREGVVPIFVTFAGSLMGFFIVIAYIYLDKDQGVIKALAVTPVSVFSYLLSKILVILTMVIISSSIIAIPIMGLKPNYFLFYLFILVTTFAFAALGLLIASFFDSISKSFGVLYLIILILLVPGFSYYISSFNPTWVRFLPTYPVLQAFKGILMGQPDWSYVLIYSAVFLVVGLGILKIAETRYKRSLAV